jgi:hypothetical protein
MNRIAIHALLGILLLSPALGQTPPKEEKTRPEQKPEKYQTIDVHPKTLADLSHDRWERPVHVHSGFLEVRT